MKNNIYSFLEMIVRDNESFPFPVNHIRKELEHLMLSSQEFDYFIRQAHRRIKNTYGIVYSQIFIYIVDKTFSDLPEEYTDEDYIDSVLNFISTLEEIRICRIDKNSPDGETISAMR